MRWGKFFCDNLINFYSGGGRFTTFQPRFWFKFLLFEIEIQLFHFSSLFCDFILFIYYFFLRGVGTFFFNFFSELRLYLTVSD